MLCALAVVLAPAHDFRDCRTSTSDGRRNSILTVSNAKEYRFRPSIQTVIPARCRSFANWEPVGTMVPLGSFVVHYCQGQFAPASSLHVHSVQVQLSVCGQADNVWLARVPLTIFPRRPFPNGDNLAEHPNAVNTVPAGFLAQYSVGWTDSAPRCVRS